MSGIPTPDWLRRLLSLLAVLLIAGCADAAGAPTAPPGTRMPPPTSAPATTQAATTEPPPAPTIASAAAPAPPTSAAPAATVAPVTAPAFSYPIGAPGRPLGDGFFIRHGFDTENTWYNPGYWHTGEDWYALEGDTAGAAIYAIGDGEVVYAGANYPGRVVIVRHAADLFSMYGHLDPALDVVVGQRIARGAQIGTVLKRADQTPSHLHFELRTFLTSGPVNGARPRYGFRCGVNCPPGPGYWPIEAPELPDVLGWRNPTHTIARLMLPPGAASVAVVATRPISPSLALWSAPPADPARQAVGQLALTPGARLPLLGVWAGPAAPQATGAGAYQLWYQIQPPGQPPGWAQATVPSTFETGADGRPSSVYFNLLPAASGK